ncbi:MAG: formylglycine-generating enzyme family protein [Desulfovibrionaceae bacterium]
MTSRYWCALLVMVLLVPALGRASMLPGYVLPEEEKPVAAIPTAPGASTPGAAWREPATGMDFIWVPAGCFQMGSPDTEAHRDPDEGPLHEVCVDGFWMGKNEVTVGQFRAFVDATGYRTDADQQGKAWIFDESTEWTWKEVDGKSWRDVGFAQDDRHPVVNVSWNDAKAFVRWVSGKGGGSFRLPTEAEWEYAARAGTTTMFYWGSEAKACSYANVADLTAFPSGSKRKWGGSFACTDKYWGTAPVGSYRANAFGLHDMLGNVWEWCADWYGKEYYASSPRNKPTGPASGSYRVFRGGSWSSGPSFARAANRYWFAPYSRCSYLGLRLIRMP